MQLQVDEGTLPPTGENTAERIYVNARQKEKKMNLWMCGCVYAQRDRQLWKKRGNENATLTIPSTNTLYT